MKKSAIFGFLITGILAVAGVIYYGQQYATVSSSYFPESGYVLMSDALDSASKKVEFSAGASYQSSADGSISFQDIQQNTAAVEETSFIHYDDSSLAALGQGLIVELDEVNNASFINHYSISSQVVLYSSNDGYQVDNQGVVLDFGEFIWKTSEDTYMIVAQDMDINFGADDVRAVEGFVEISYVDTGVVQIQTQDNLWQTISPACTVSVGDLEIYLVDRYITDTAGTPIFYLSNMVIHADDNIVIHNIDQVTSAELSVPKFDITTEDGQDGAQGDEGTSGEQGEQGVEGEQGEQGEQGVEGDPGQDGAAGAAGEIGADGDTGDDGDKGNKGSTGSTGVTGGTGGTTEEDEDGTVETLAQPTFSLDSWMINANSVTFSITATDEDGALFSDENYPTSVYLVDMSTGQIVYETTHDFFTQLTYSATLPSGNSNEGVTVLTPDTQYMLGIQGYYLDYDENIFKAEFFSKTFYTDSSGVFIESAYVAETELRVNLSRKDYSMAVSATVYIFDNYDAASNFALTDLTTAMDSASYSFLGTGVEDSTTLTFATDLYPDTNYYFRVAYTTEATATASATTTLTNTLLQMVTLKELPTVNTPVVVTNRGTYTFDVYPSVVDSYNGIQSVNYYVYYEGEYEANPATATVKTTVKSYNTDMVSIPVDGVNVQAEYSYVIVMEVVFYDNEKTVYITSDASSAVVMTGAQMPTVTFVFSEGCGTNYTSTYAESISGLININANSGDSSSTTAADVAVTAEMPLSLTITAPGVYQKVEKFTTTSDVTESGVASVSVANGVYTINNIDLTSLKEATTYTFTVSGYVDFHDQTTENYVQTVIGSVVISTAYEPTVTANYAAISGLEDGFDMTMTFSAAQNDETVTSRAMGTVEVMEVSLYKGSYAEEEFLVETITITDENEDIYTSDIADTAYGDGAVGYNFTEKSFQSELNGSYTMTVSGLYDYTYNTVYSGSNSEGIYIDTYYNEIPVDEESNSFQFSVSQGLPDLPEVGDMTTMTITNNMVEAYGGVYDPSLDDNAIVGYLLDSKYDDTMDYAVNITYYAFESNAFNTFFNSDHSYADYKDSEITVALESVSKVEIYDPVICGEELYATPAMTVGTSVPTVIMLFGTPSDDVWSGTTSQGVAYYYTGDYDYDDNSGISRGMQLTFTYVVGYNEFGTSNVQGYYPYAKYTSGTQILPTTRTYIQDTPRSRPLFYAYPWASNSNYSVWKYWTYDADGTMDTSSTNGTNKVDLLLEGKTYYLEGLGFSLPGGLNMTDTEFANSVYQDAYGAGNSTASLSLASSADSISMSNLVVNLRSQSADTLQMSVDATFYNEDLYPDGANLDKNALLSSGANASKGTDGNVLSNLTLFRVDNTDADSIGAVSTMAQPTFDTDTTAGTYTLSFANVFPEWSSTDNTAAAATQEVLAGVYLVFTSGSDSVKLYKTLSSTGKITGNLSELEDVAMKDPTLKVYYMYPSQDRGYYSVRSGNEYALRYYYADGTAGNYVVPNNTGTALQANNSSSTPVLSSFFTSKSSAGLGTTAAYNVYALDTDSLITSMTSASQDNMFYTGGVGEISFETPVTLSMSAAVELGQMYVPYGVPEIDLPTANIEKTISSISLNAFDVYGATTENVGDYMYFTISFYSADGTVSEELEANYETEVSSTDVYLIDPSTNTRYWKVYLDDRDDLYKTWEDLERGTRYTITAYTKADGGNATTYDKLTKYGLDDSAVYYVTTTTDVEVGNISSGYIVADYSTKYFYAAFSLTEIQNLYLEYEIFNVDGTPAGLVEGVDYTVNADGTLSVYTPYYYKEDTSGVYSTESTYVQFDFGFENYAMLDSGDYYLEVRVVSTASTGDDALLGIQQINFTVPTVYDPYVDLYPVFQTYTDLSTDMTLSTPYGLEITVCIDETGRVITSDDTNMQGQYVLKLYEVDETTGALIDCAYTSVISNSGSAVTHYISDLEPGTTYQAVVIALLDENSDGLYYDAATDTYVAMPSLEEFLTSVDDSMIGLDDDTFDSWYNMMLYEGYSDCVYVEQYSSELFTTMTGNGIYYESVTLYNYGADVYVVFGGGVNLDGAVASVTGTLRYYDNGSFKSITVNLEDPYVEDCGGGVYRVDTEFDIIDNGSRITLTNFVVKLYDGTDDNGDPQYIEEDISAFYTLSYS